MQRRVIGNRYNLVQSLGKGTFGEVYEAEDTKFDPPRRVALKLLRGDLLEDQSVREEVKREASTLARFSHPNILRVIDFEVNQDLAYIVTDLADSGSLEKKIRPDPKKAAQALPLEEVSSYLQQIADALDEAHSQGLIHRDIKPANILINKRGQVMLADFGLASALSSTSSSTMVDTEASGTPLYMAPEQWQGQAGKVSDVYALGVLTYQMITGQTPFQGNTSALAYQHTHEMVPTLSKRAPNLKYPPALDEIMAQAMAKEPGHRFRRAGDFYRRFRSVLDTANGVNSVVRNETPRAGTKELDPQLPVSKVTTQTAEEKQTSQQVADLFGRLSQFEARQEWERVIELGERIVKLDKDHRPTRIKLAMAYHMRGADLWSSSEYGRAIQAYNRAIELDDREATYFNRRGKCYYDQHDYDRAILDFNVAINLDPTKLYSNYWRGLSYYYKRDYKQAVNDFTEAIDFEPDRAEYYFYRALSFKGAIDRPAARADFMQSLDMGYPMARSEIEKMDTEEAEEERRQKAQQISDLGKQMGQAELRLDWKAAIEIGNQIFELDMKHQITLNRVAAAYKELAVLQNKQGNYEEAVRQLNQAIQFDSSKGTYFWERGKSYLWQGNIERTLADFGSAIQLDPQNADYLLERSKLYQQRGDQARASADYNRAVQIRAARHIEQGGSYYLKGEFDKAIAEYTWAVQLESNKADYYYRRGAAYNQKGDYEQAIGDYSRAVQLDPAKANYFYSRSISFSHKKDLNKAIADLTSAIQLEPQNAGHYYWRALTYIAKKDKRAAKSDLTKAAEMGHKEAKDQLKQM